jgi:hypothetical protein
MLSGVQTLTVLFVDLALGAGVLFIVLRQKSL